MKCEMKTCVNQAVLGLKFCIYHDPEKIKQAQTSSLPAEAFEFVPLASVPLNRSFDQAAFDLVKAARVAEGKALRVSLKVFSKKTLNKVARYSLEGGARVSVRYAGDFCYVWKMTADQLAAAEKKAKRLADAREKRGGRKKLAVAR